MAATSNIVEEEYYPSNRATGIMSKVLANVHWDQGSIPRRVKLKTQKMALDSALLNTQHCKVWIKGKVEQSREWSNVFSQTLGLHWQRSPTYNPSVKV